MSSADHDRAISPNDDGESKLEPVAFAPTEFEARTKAAVLEDEGIQTFVFGAERAWTGGLSLRPAKPGVPVLVRHADLERARTILDSRLADSVDLDWNQVEVGEPDGDPGSARPRFIGIMRELGRLGAIVIIAIIALSLAMALLSLVVS